MTEASTRTGSGSVWSVVLARFEQHAPASVMARTALEHALPADWIDTVFEAERQRQYSRELLFSTVVELMTLVSLGLRPSLHAAARQMGDLPVSLASLYDKVNHTEPGILRALVQGSAQRLAPVMAAVGTCPALPGYQLRVLDGNHLPGSEKRLAVLRGHRGAALPGQSIVVYDPDSGLVSDLIAGEDAHQSERTLAIPVLQAAGPGQAWIADRHFCTRTLLVGWDEAGASFIVREHTRHPRLAQRGERRCCGCTDTGTVHEQAITLEGFAKLWRCIELRLDAPTEDGETTIRLWTNLPAWVSAAQVAALYRRRWTIEGMFQRLESVLHSEVASLGHPRAALLGFAVSLLAYNVLALIGRCVEQAHQHPTAPPPDVSLFHLAVSVTSGYQGMLIVLPPEHWTVWRHAEPAAVAKRLLQLARQIDPKRVATSKRKPKCRQPKGYVDGKTARAHVATARVLAQATP
jgi:IS4 transposase